MYINEVIKLARNYLPSEYSITELYKWCNEVSAMLVIEDRCTYKEKILPIANDGTVLLPEGVSFENVERIISGSEVIAKHDLRTASKAIYVKGRNGFIINRRTPHMSGTARVIYLAPYEPIRLIKYKGTMTADAENKTIGIKRCEFIPGDILRITAGDIKLEEIYLMSVDYADDGTAILGVEGDLSALPETSEDVTITRHITEKTVCDAPFDDMYVDYILAKINLFQRDMQEYNQYMTAFNSRLAAYKEWLVNHMPQGESVLKNWW